VTTYPSNFIAADYSTSKAANLVFSIAGWPVAYSLQNTSRYYAVYGDPVSYGDSGLYYGVGGPYKLSAIKPYISDESSLAISQRVEPEQGRGNTSEITVVLIDKEQEINRLIAPDTGLPEILGTECTLWYGFANTSYPDDYQVVFRGYITNVVTQAGKIRLTVSDATQKKRQAATGLFKDELFLPLRSNGLSVSLTNGQTLATDFSSYLNIAGVYDPYIARYLKIADEYVLLDPSFWLNYPQGSPRGIGVTSRGQLGSTAAAYGPIRVAPVSPATSSFLDLSLNGTNFSASLPAGDYDLNTTFSAGVTTCFTESLRNQLATAWAGAGGNPAYSFDVRNWLNEGQDNYNRNDYLFSYQKPNQYKFLIVAKTSNPVSYPINTFNLRFASGPNSANSLAKQLGFDSSPQVDYTGATSYLSPKWQSVNNANVEQVIVINDHPINVALTFLLSQAPLTVANLQAIGTSDGVTHNGSAILLAPGIDAKRDLGLTAGLLPYGSDVTKFGDAVLIQQTPVNPTLTNWCIIDILDGPNNPNQVLIVASLNGLVPELAFDATPGMTAQFRSKYDRLPAGYGLKIPMNLVDVEAHETIRDVYLPGAPYTIYPVISGAVVGKEYIESQCYLPFGCYGVTAQGRLSVAITRPPLPGTIPVQIDKTNIVNPQNITVTRGLNSRRFFNLIQYQYDKGLDGKYGSVYRGIDTASVSTFKLQYTLPINSDGIKTTYNGVSTGSPIVVADAADRFLQRYANIASEIRVQVNSEAGSLIEAGDIIKLVDDGSLGIANIITGQRNLGTNLLEVIDRNLDIKSGICSLTLLANLGFLASDRYGSIAPSSEQVNPFFANSTSTDLAIQPSFGAVFGSLEYKKWKPYIGQKVIVHTRNYSSSAATTIVGVQAPNPNDPFGRLFFSPALPFDPLVIYPLVIDLYEYDSVALPNNDYSRSVHAYVDPTVLISSAINEVSFKVLNADASKLFVGAIIYVRNGTSSQKSPEVPIVSLTAGASETTVLVDSDLTFTPAVGDFIEIIGFSDDNSTGYLWS